MKTLALAVLLIPSAAAAAPAPSANSSDPNAVICRVSGETGSRLARARTCKTRAEWEEIRREQRNAIDRAQAQQGNRTVDEAARGN